MSDRLEFDPLSTAFRHDANKIFAFMRRNHPVLRHGDSNWPLLSIFRYRDIRRALFDFDTWSSEIPAVADLVLGDASIMIQDDPPQHTRYKRLIAPHLNQAGLKRLGVEVEQTVSSHFGRMLNQEVDFVENFAARVSVQVISDVIGIPIRDRAYLRDWTNRLAASVGSEFLDTDRQRLDRQKALVTSLHLEFTQYLELLLKSRRDRPERGMIAALERTQLSDTEKVGLLKSIAFAGNHTSSILSTNAVWLMAKHPEARRRLTLAPGLLNSAVDEILRYKGTFRGVTRIATRSGQIAGCEFNPGDYLLAWITSANWDERRFQAPDEFDITRQANRHLAFAVGPHFCIGADLAKLELRVLLQLIREKVREIEILAEPEPIDDPWVDGFLNLNVVLRGM